MTTRRQILAAAASVVPALAVAAEPKKPHLATNQYPWLTFFAREKRDWNQNLEASLREVAKAGLDGLEPLLGGPDDIKRLAPLLKKVGLEMRSLYMGATLHEEATANQAIKSVLAVGGEAKKAGTRIVVLNPAPIDGDKSDEQLMRQAANLDRLGKELRNRGLTLAYHNHDAEMRKSAREFHHMMLGTEPANVSLCLDSHWVYRGSGNSQVALFDVVKVYGKRIVELHLRQSSQGVWTETFGPGDIDHGRLATALAALKIRPHLVLEQAVEGKTPNTLTAVEAHKRGAAYARKTLARLG